jgi:hypothetical protein
MTTFNHLNVPDQWNQYFTKYPQGYTILEALLNWVQQVDDMVDNVNDWNTYLDNFVKTFDTDLQEQVRIILTEWLESGLLASIITTDVLKIRGDILSVKNPPAPYTGAVGNANYFNAGKFYADGAFTIEATDDAPAIQALLNAGFSLFFPDGNYLIKSTLTSPSGVPIRIKGASQSAVLKRGFNGGYILNASGASTGTKEWANISNIKIHGSDDCGFIGGGIDWSYNHFFYSENLVVTNCKGGAGINFTQSWDGTFIKPTVMQCGDKASQIGALVFQDTATESNDRIIFFSLHAEVNYWSHIQGKNNFGHTNDKIDFIESKFHGWANTSDPNYHTGWNVDFTNMRYSHIIGGELGHGEKHLFLNSDQNIIRGLQITFQDGTTAESVNIAGSANEVDIMLGATQGLAITGSQNDIKVKGVSVVGSTIRSNTGTQNFIQMFNGGELSRVYGTDIWSGRKINTAYKTANYTAILTDDVIIANGTITVTLPTVASAAGKEYIVHNLGNTAVTVAAQGTEQINGATTYLLDSGTVNQACRVVCDGTKWYVISTGNPKVASVSAIVDSTGGSKDNTLVAVTGTGADSSINGNFADVAQTLNGIIDKMKRFGMW